MKYKVFDNFLPNEEFNAIANIIMSQGFHWYYLQGVASKANEGERTNNNNFFFAHLLYAAHQPTCNHYNDIMGSVERALNVKANMIVKSVIRIKCNLYTRTEKILEHEFHSDQNFSHHTCILGINDNDGYTIFENGDKVESKANRMLVFDGYDKHCSTTCTDQKVRLNINFNFL